MEAENDVEEQTAVAVSKNGRWLLFGIPNSEKDLRPQAIQVRYLRRYWFDFDCNETVLDVSGKWMRYPGDVVQVIDRALSMGWSIVRES